MAETDATQSDEELRLLADSMATLLERAGGVERARRLRGSAEGWSAAVLREIAEAGVLGILVPGASGGLDMGLPAAGVVARELGRALAPEPVVPLMALTLGVLRRLCPDHPLIGRIVAGVAVPALAHAERGPIGAPAEGCATRLHATGNGPAVTGSKAWVMGAASADSFLVLAEGKNGSALVKVACDAPGVTIVRRPQSDGSVALEIVFAATPAEMLAEGEAVTEALEASLDDARALAAAELLGVASRAFEITHAFLGTREQFGQPIGKFQVLQHRAVDMHIALQMADAAVSEALARMQASDDAALRAREASRAKARAGRTARQITREAIQMHGAIGYTDEYDIGLYLNRTLVLDAWLGGAGEHSRRWLALSETGEALQ